MTPALEWWLTPVVFAASAAGTAIARRYGASKLLDVPNERSSHTRAVPRGGGIAIVLAFLGAIVVLWLAGALPARLFAGLLVGGGTVAVVGYWDDHVNLSARLRFSLHAAASVLAVALIGPIERIPLLDSTWTLPAWLAWPLSILAVAWLLNLYNFMDGIDGIAAGEAVTVAAAAAVVAAVVGLHLPGLAVLAAAAAGFLVFNWPPARIFMGDVGSGFLGYVFGVFLLFSATQDPRFVWVWIVLLGVFWIDATVTLARRLLAGQELHVAHRSHAYQRAAMLLGSHRTVTLSVMAVNVLLLLPVAALSAAAASPRHAHAAALATVAALAAVALWLGAGRTAAPGRGG